ncbi:MAG TPA: polyprenol monophosphomannose synthase [Acidimicrobiales bacterium]|nr:polyprenol monophosphomannose synthase [Acidimicrobiales bacterium]
MRCLIVLPTYQEAANVVAVLRRVRAAMPAVQVLVVDDNSPDGTADLAEAAATELGAVQVTRRPAKSGLGSAYRAGFQWGLGQGFEVLIEMDADLSHEPSDVPRLVASVEEGADLVIGSRYMPGGSIPDWSWHRRALSRYGNRYAAAMLRIPVTDATSGLRAYRASMQAEVGLETVRADGYGFQVEMAYRVAQRGGKVVEIPISFVDRTLGQSKMSTWIVLEAFGLVTWWGLRDRLLRSREA